VDSGSTAIVALITASKIFVANIGDSRAILGRLDPSPTGENITVIELSHDHKPEMPEELERIKKAGGRVDNEGRIDGGLNLSRAFGNNAFYDIPCLDVTKM
jgi:protein phosphatase 1G